ncbi:hypothetical protein ACJ41O_014650 [Fusarium nematophilum]
MFNKQHEDFKKELKDRLSEFREDLIIRNETQLQGTEERIQKLFLDSFETQRKLPTSPTDETTLNQHMPVPPAPDYEAHPHPDRVNDPDSSLAITQAQYDDLKAESAAEIEAIKIRLEDERRKASEAQAKVARYHGLLTNGGSTVVMDSDIEKKFREVRNLTQLVAAKLYGAEKSLRRLKMDDEQKKFFADLSCIDSKHWQERIWAEIFEQLCRVCFYDPPDFGLGEVHRTLSTHLAQAEMTLKTEINRRYPDGFCCKEVAEWRQASLSFAGLLGGVSDRPALIYHHLRDYFEPAETSDQKDWDRGEDLLGRLSKESHALNILMRRAEDTFLIFTPRAEDDLEDCKEHVEELKHEGPLGARGKKVMLRCLFGGLRKIPVDEPRNVITLEKAQVLTTVLSTRKDQGCGACVQT